MTKYFSKLNLSRQTIFEISLIMLAAILVSLPIILNGVPATQDIPQQYQFAQNFYNSILNGNLYPSWADQPNLGYGDVSVRFYPPLTYYILSFFRSITSNWFDASILFFISIYFLSGLGVYQFCKQYFSSKASLFAGIVYIWLPYHVMQIYIGGVFAEFTAAAILPFCLLFVNKVCSRGKLIDVLGLAFTFALIFLTHLPTSVFASITLFIYSLFTLRKADFLQTVLKLTGSVLLSLLLSSFYLVRLITELDWVKQSGENFTTGSYSYKTQFVFSYFFPFLDITRASVLANFNIMTFLTIGIFLTGVYYCYREGLSALKNVVAITFFGLFMATPLSLMIWEFLPILQRIQFPFRWLTIFTLGGAILSAGTFTIIAGLFKTSQRYIALIVCGVLCLTILYDYNSLMSSDITFPRFFLNTISTRFKTMPSYECWWTSWAEKSDKAFNRPDFIADKIEAVDRSFEINKWDATERNFSINDGKPQQITVATLYYPHWKAEVNGEQAPVSPTEKGLISLPISDKKSIVRLYFQEPPYGISAFYFSGFAWIIFFAMLIFSARKSSEIQS